MHELLDKEKEIMDIYWAANEPYLISDVLRTNPSLNRNTVVKALVSLEKKGYLKVAGIKHTVTRTGRACLIDQGKVDDDFISELESMIQTYKNRKE